MMMINKTKNATIKQCSRNVSHYIELLILKSNFRSPRLTKGVLAGRQLLDPLPEAPLGD
jgi:hypothetical protein